MLIIVAIFSSSASESLLSRFSTSWLIDITLLDNLELTLFSPESPDFVSPDIFSLIFEKKYVFAISSYYFARSLEMICLKSKINIKLLRCYIRKINVCRVTGPV